MKKVNYLSSGFKVEQKQIKKNSSDILKNDFFQTATFDIGFRILIPLLLCIFIGKKIDTYYKLDNIGTIVGIICGCCFIFVAMIKLARDN